VKEGDEVKAGDPLFFDKRTPEIKYVAPVSGEVAEIRRGSKRAITEVIILADKDIKYKKFKKIDLEDSSREKIVEYLLESGIWPFIKKRPYGVVPNPNTVPENIFISTFDTAPLAADLRMVVDGKLDAFQEGIRVLNKLTDGSVFLGLDGNDPADSIFSNVEGVVSHVFHGAHPAGNVGVQIHHIENIGKGSAVWTLGVQDVITLGRLFTEQKYDASRVIGLTGAEIKNNKYVDTYLGASIKDLLKKESIDDNLRVISGNVLSGEKKDVEGFVNAFDNHLTVIKEGDYYEMFGWLMPITPRPSISKTYPNFLFKDLEFTPDTNTHGEKRAFVMTGQYEKVLPMDLYPQHLLKAILANDYERMEGLGIYELEEEDIALCEFACTSKMPLQKILREGLDMMADQG
jgi:Na+-transporting NADH:ubiquinone oxidoreductase subunit A